MPEKIREEFLLLMTWGINRSSSSGLFAVVQICFNHLVVGSECHVWNFPRMFLRYVLGIRQ